MTASLATIDDVQEALSSRPLRAEVMTAQASPEELLVAHRASWFRQSAGRLAELAELKTGWDSYGARAPSQQTVRDGIALLTLFVDLGVPQPHVSPTTIGGIQFEWDVRGLELELELLPDGRMLAIFEDGAQGKSWERELPRHDLGPVSDALGLLAQAGRSG